MTTNENRVYHSTIRSAAKKVELLHGNFGTPKNSRILVGVLGWQIKEGLRKSSGPTISAVNSFLREELYLTTKEHPWITVKTIRELKKIRSAQLWI